MQNTYDEFNSEWYDFRADLVDPENNVPARVPPIPDVYLNNQRLQETLGRLRKALHDANKLVNVKFYVHVK